MSNETLVIHYKTHFLYQNTVANSIQTTSLHQVMYCFANSVKIMWTGNVQRLLVI